MRIDDFGVESWINSHEKTCKIDLTTTCVGIMGTGELLDLTNDKELHLKNILNLKLGYGKVFGTERLRSNIAGLYDCAKDENIVVTHGAICANSLVFLSLIEPDDEVITYLPIYQQHYSIPQSIGARVKKLYLKPENNWLPDLDELKNTISNKTKLVCINNPNNPTGAHMDEYYLKNFVEVVGNSGAYILSDEVYRGLNHSGAPFGKSIFDLYEKGISTSSMSKTFSLPGLRLGWITAPKEVTDKINIQRNYHVISVGLINDYLASVALENKLEIVRRNISICKTNLEKLDLFLAQNPLFSYIKPHTGTVAFIKYNKNIPSKHLCEEFQNETGIMILPGQVMEYEGYIRVGFGDNIDDVIASLEKLTEFIR